MTAFDYARSLATANRLIERFGQTGAIQRFAKIGADYDPRLGDPTDHPAKFVIVGYSDREIDGTRIASTDKKALLAPGGLTITPTTQDSLVEADGTVWKIVGPVQTLRPAETTLLYTLQVRR